MIRMNIYKMISLAGLIYLLQKSHECKEMNKFQTFCAGLVMVISFPDI